MTDKLKNEERKEKVKQYLEDAKAVAIEIFQVGNIDPAEYPSSFWKNRNWESVVIEIAKMLQKEDSYTS